MSDSKELRVAAKELVDVLGLVDKNKKDIVITKAMDDDDVLKIINDALPLIDPKQDTFSEETQEVIDKLNAPDEEEEEEAPPTRKKKSKVVIPDEDEDEDEEDDKPVVKQKKSGGPPKGVKPNFKKEGSMAQFLDETVKAGGTWDEMAAACKEEGESRGVNTKFTPSVLKAHAKFRVSKDAKFLGKFKITDEGVE